MYQLSENDKDTSCHAKAKARGQKTFTLVEQDQTTVETIAYWILLNSRTATIQKLHDAIDTIVAMRDFPDQKAAT
jgi:acyl-ACP thioesterase